MPGGRLGLSPLATRGGYPGAVGFWGTGSTPCWWTWAAHCQVQALGAPWCYKNNLQHQGHHCQLTPKSAGNPQMLEPLTINERQPAQRCWRSLLLQKWVRWWSAVRHSDTELMRICKCTEFCFRDFLPPICRMYLTQMTVFLGILQVLMYLFL